MSDYSLLSHEQTLETFLVNCQNRVNQSLESCLQNSASNPELVEALSYACLNGGKRIRPVLVYASAMATQSDIDAANAPACAVELIHSYSLVHDDLPAMDDDDLRRGKPSLHKAYDEATAILVGDALQSLAFEVLSSSQHSLPMNSRLRMVTCIAEAIGPKGMVGGQFDDFKVTGTDATEEKLEALHRCKTGALIKAAVTMGAMCNPSLEPEQLNALQRYADCIGLAFQVQDDVLDEISDTETLGKPQGSDRFNNKPTYVTVLGLDGAKAKAQALVEEAIQSIHSFPEAAAQLRNLASYIVSRSH